MQINNLVNLQKIQPQHNFKESSAEASTIQCSQTYQPIPLETSKAYATPQIKAGYKELTTFEIPYIGKGKLYKLANGHKVVIVPKASKTYISTVVGTGFSDEPADKKNIAHLTEHLLANYWFNASQDSDITKTLTDVGAYSNADTGSFNTSYHMSANVQDNKDLENLIKIQLGILINNKYDNEKIEKEKNIITEECNEREYFTDSERAAQDQSIKNLFNLENTNGIVAKTSPQAISSIKKDDLDQFYNKYYRPDNMTTYIIGNIDDNSIKIISKYLNKMANPNSKLARDNAESISNDNYIKQPIRTDLVSEDNQNKFRCCTELSFIGPKVDNVIDTENILVLNKIIKNRLKLQNVDIEALTPTISTDKNIPQIVSIKINSRNEEADKNINKLYSEINNLKQNPISIEELKKAKEDVSNEILDRLETNEDLTSYLNDELLSNPKMKTKEDFEYIKNISTAELQNTAKQYFILDKSSLVVVHPNTNENKVDNSPKGSSKITSSQVAFKGLAELKDKSDIKEYDLPNNLHLIFDTRPGIVKTAVSCDFAFENRAQNNKGMMEAMQSSLIRDDDIESMAGHWIEKESLHIRKFGTSENILSLINEIKTNIVNPEFRIYKLESSKILQRENLKEPPKDSCFDFLLERNNSPKSEKEVCPEWVNVNDLKKYYKSLLGQSQGTIVITMPKEKLAEVQPDIIKSLSEIPAVKQHDFSKIASQYVPKDLDKNYVFLEKYNDFGKVSISKEFKIVHKGNMKDEAGIVLLSKILNNKLQKTLRTDLGLTYNATSSIDKSSPKHSILTISTDIAKTPLDTNTKTMLEQIDNVIRNLNNLRIDADTLESAKKQAQSDILIPAETSVDRNMDLEADYRKTYDVDYNKKLSEAMETMTSDELQKIAQKYLTKHSVLELSGDTKAIEANNNYLLTQGEIVN